MEGINNTLNVTMQAFQLLSEAYNYCYINLQNSNVPIPPLEQVISNIQYIIAYIVSNSPGYIQQLYSTLAKLPVQPNATTLFVGLLIAYVFYCITRGILSWIYRLVYGFVRFSLFVLSVGGLVYLLQSEWFANNVLSKQNGYNLKSFT